MATNFVAKLPTPPALITLAFRHGMGYRYLNVRINSVNYASISFKNVVNFGPVTPEKTGLICELFVRHGKQERLAVASIARDDPSTLPGDDPFPRAAALRLAVHARTHSHRMKAL